jgi:hypothetical protein
VNASRDGCAVVYELAAETDGIALGNGGGVCSNGNGWGARWSDLRFAVVTGECT